MNKEEATKAHNEGREAFKNSKTLKDCPYPIGDERRFLWTGGYSIEKNRPKHK